MAIVVNRPKLTFAEKCYLPSILAGLAITWKHLKRAIFNKGIVTMQYPAVSYTHLTLPTKRIV